MFPGSPWLSQGVLQRKLQELSQTNPGNIGNKGLSFLLLHFLTSKRFSIWKGRFLQTFWMCKTDVQDPRVRLRQFSTSESNSMSTTLCLATPPLNKKGYFLVRVWHFLFLWILTIFHDLLTKFNEIYSNQPKIWKN